MTARKLAALKNLAERPGTPAEGELARELLRKYESSNVGVDDDLTEDDYWKAFKRHMRGESSTEEFLDALRRYAQRPVPENWTCACGTISPLNQKCQNSGLHIKIQFDIRNKFKKGDCVYYNYWAYPINQPATVTGYVPSAIGMQWNWIAVKLVGRRGKSNLYRQIPIYSAKGWHLSHAPLSEDEAERLARA